jgi:hypothetical protein
MSTEQKSALQDSGRWLRVGLLALNTASPVINLMIERLRRQNAAMELEANRREALLAESAIEEEEESETISPLQRLDELALASRGLASTQAKQLMKQARSWQKQAKHLRKALRQESKQRRDLNRIIKQLQASGIDWSQELLRRSGSLTEGLVAQSGKVSHDLTERGSKVTRDIVARSSDLSQDLLQRGSKATQELVERGSTLSQDLLKRGSDATHDLLAHVQPPRKRSTFLTILGFGIGLVVAAVVTYVFLRQRIEQQATEQNAPIELPSSNNWNGTSNSSRPAGEIRRLDSEGTPVATATRQAVDVEQQIKSPAQQQVETLVNPSVIETPADEGSAGEVPVDAAFVGVVLSKVYYPVGANIDAKDVIYFASEEEAKAEGYTRAE